MEHKEVFKFRGDLDPEKDKKILVERSELLETYIPEIRLGNNYAIYGPRMSGKTTFLKKIAYELKNHRQPLFLNFHERYLDTKVEFYEWFFMKVQSELDIEIDFQNIITCAEFEEGLKGLSDKISLPLTIYFDDAEECDCLEEVLNDFRDILKSKNTYSRFNKIALIMTGRADFIHHVVNNNSPFNDEDPIELRDFTKEEVKGLIENDLPSNKPKLESGVIDGLYKYTCGHPQLTQHLAQLLFAKPDNKTDISHLNDCLQQIHKTNNVPISLVTKDIQKHKELRELLDELNNGSKIKIGQYEKYVNLGAGIIKNKDDYCQFRNPIFEIAAKEFLKNKNMLTKV